ncbi:hypothetical protein TEA_012645 [Camellia sinensis var. sinensis]|uniref:Uncharacterized protein n=1 Tax=Camellia sinensis var. sinensis TaxID=542762 RepID=A0A4S4DH25_CAMSN|nr:hypothetical protein TEA_012645 [Camellia sinensis var. sinensis]
MYVKGAVDEITTVSERFQGADPILERLRSLKIATPILTALPTETSLTDMLVRKPSSSSAASGDIFFLFENLNNSAHLIWELKLNVKVFDEPIIGILLPMDEIGTVNPKVLLELFSVHRDWQEAKAQKIIHALKVELGELKGRLTEVISNCDALCRRINSEGPESLRSSVKPFSSVTPTDLETSSSLPHLPLKPS